MRRCGPKKFVWYVSVCDYESCWPIAFFDSEEKAKSHKNNYKLKEHNFERDISVYKAEVF